MLTVVQQDARRDANPYGRGVLPELERQFERQGLLGSPYNVGEQQERSFYSEKDDQDKTAGVHPVLAGNRALFMGVFAFLAGIVALVAAILVLVVYARTKTGLLLFLGLSLLLVALVGFAIAVGSFMFRSSIAIGLPENKTLTSFVYIGSICGALFLLTSVLLLLLHRYAHFNNILAVFDSGKNGDQYPSNMSFQDAWTSDKRMLWWSAAMCLLGALGLAISGFFMWSISKYMILLSRGLLAISGVLAILFLTVSFYQAQVALYSPLDLSVVQNIFTVGDWKTVTILGAFLISVILINLFLNIIKKRVGFFIVGLILLIFVLVFAVKLAQNLRGIRSAVAPGKVNTDSALGDMTLLYEDDFKPICQKYMPDQTNGCPKSLSATYFETNNSKRTLNPNCARIARMEILSAAYYAGVFGLLAVAFAAIVIACDFYLSDLSEFLETYNRQTTVLEYIGVGLALLILAIGLIWWAVATFPTYRSKPRLDSDLSQKLKDGSYVDSDFQTVPTSIIKSATTAANVCTKYDASKMVSFGVNSACKFPKCEYRVFILGESMQIAGLQSPMNANQNLRSSAFPGAQNSLDGFLYIRGSATEVNAQLSKLLFCGLRYDQDLSIFYKAEEVDSSTLSYDGIKSGEITVPPTLSETGPRGYPTGYSFGTNLVCKSASCNYENRIPAPTDQVAIIGQIYIKTTSGVYSTADAAALKSIRIDAYHGSDLYTSKPEGTLSGDGTVLLLVPASTNTPYPLRVVFTDKNNKFLPFEKEFIVGTSAGQLSMGRIPLILPNGQGCKGATNFAACLDANTTPRQGMVQVTVYDADTNQPISGATVSLFKNHVIGTAAPVYTGKSGADGKATFNGVSYNYYTVTAGDNKHIEGLIQPILESDAIFEDVYLVPDQKTAMDVSLYMQNALAYDTDLKVRFRSNQGKECLVSAENKYCGYAQYLFDVGAGQSGMETVRLYQMTVSHYMVFTETIFINSGSCQGYQNANTHFLGSIDWYGVSTSHLQDSANRPSTDPSTPFWVAYCLSGFGQPSLKNVNMKFKTDPAISTCSELFPDSDKYSLANLQQAISKLSSGA